MSRARENIFSATDEKLLLTAPRGAVPSLNRFQQRYGNVLVNFPRPTTAPAAPVSGEEGDAMTTIPALAPASQAACPSPASAPAPAPFSVFTTRGISDCDLRILVGQLTGYANITRWSSLSKPARASMRNDLVELLRALA